MCADAKVRSLAERKVAVHFSADVEFFGCLAKLAFVTVARRKEHMNFFAGGDLHAVKLDIARRGSRKALYGRVDSQELLDRTDDHAGVVDKEAALKWVIVE